MNEHRLTQLDIERYAYGEDDSLEEAIFSSPEYLDVLERIWSEELPRDLAPRVLQALRVQKFMSDASAVTLDLGLAMGRAISHHLLRAATRDEPDERSGDSPTADS